MTYVESKKKKLRWNYLQNKNRLTDTENTLIVTKEEKGGEGKHTNYYI